MSMTTDQLALDVPSRIDDVVSSSIAALNESLTRSVGRKFRNITILHFDPRLGAYFHLIPGQQLALGGPASEYFKTFCLLRPRPTMPHKADLEALIEFATMRPHVSWSITQLMRAGAHRILGMPDGSASSSQFLRQVLHVFARPGTKKSTDYISAFNNGPFLPQVVRSLLMLLPQYPVATGSAMFSDSAKADFSANWVDVDKKSRHWRKIANSSGRSSAAKPATRLFSLLSAVESLLWESNTVLGSISNIYEFLRPDFIDGTAPRLQMALSGLSAYVVLEADLRDTSALNRCEDALRRTLREHIDVLSGLAASIAVAQVHRERGRCDEMNNWPSSAIAQGLLGFVAPEAIYYRDTYIDDSGDPQHHAVGLSRGELSVLDRRGGKGEVSPLLRSCRNTWGIYQHTTTPAGDWDCQSQCGHDNLFGVCRTADTVRICTHGDRAKAQVQCVFNTAAGASCIQESSLFSGHILGRLCEEALNVRNTSPEWYEEAFGELYVAFDKKRQSRTDRQFTLRKHETDFYAELITKRAHVVNSARPLRILDIGIGYGRLAEKLLKIPAVKLELHGLDISRHMLDEAAKVPGIERQHLYLGDMQDVANILVERRDYYDLAILAFTTFGCYESHAANRRTLAGVASVLQPGGVLIIEQFHPSHVPEDPMILEETIQGRRIRLTKHTHIVDGSDDTHRLYAGEYLYSCVPPSGTRLFRRDSYCVRLYTDGWFREQLPQAGFEADTIIVSEEFGQDSEDVSCLHTIVATRSTASDAAMVKMALGVGQQDEDYQWVLDAIKELDRVAPSAFSKCTLKAERLLLWFQSAKSADNSLDGQQVEKARKRYEEWEEMPVPENAASVIREINGLRGADHVR